VQRRLRSFALCFAIVASPLAVHAQSPGSELPVHVAKDASAPEVNAANLLANERFWPYQVALAKAWKPAGSAEALAAGAVGVLIRVEASGEARVDFGRDGLFDVPVAATDLVARANQVRLGTLEKMAPNFVLAIGPRLIDAASEEPRPVRAEDFSKPRAFLCVFADPTADGFDAIAKSLAPLRDRAGLMTVFFPQGMHPDPQVREKLRAREWPVPFVHDHLADAYTPSLLADTPPPALLLVTNEGRALLRAPWSPERVAEIAPLLDASP
jgi:hypothetical protein